jgi:hypothetical protein
MKRISFLFFVVVTSFGISHSVQGQELVQNGDFSNNTAGATAYNLNNPTFTSTVAFCTGFGVAQEIDLIYDADNGPVPLVGNTKLRLHRQASGGYDAFSTTLLSPVVASSSYRLQLDVLSRYTYTETNLQVGISNSSSSFGTLLQSVPTGSGTWTSIDVIVPAPVGGGYLTFRPDPDVVDGLVSITNVSLAPAVDSTYTVGGTVSGLTGSVTLQNNSSDDIIKTTNDGFTFTAQAEGTDYVVTVSSQPSGQTCTVGNGSGTNITANITNVTVTCVTDVVPTYSVGGTVSGLTGTGLALQNNGGDTFAVAAAATAFTFATELLDLATYAVTVSTQPIGQTCSVTNGSGAIAAADVTDVAVACVDDVVVVPPTPAGPIPTLSQWALILLTMLLGLMVFANRRRLF